MRLRLMLALFCCVVFVSACNLGNVEQPTEVPLITNTPQSTGRPEVVIISPDDGDQYTVGDQVLVSVEATDASGVTRVQLFANGQIVKTVSSELLAGDQSFDAVLDYTPRATGDVTLRVLAFRNAVASDPAEVTIEVVQEQTTPVATTDNTPRIPDDGVCRVLTNVGLNLRSAPTTTRENVIRVLPSGTLAPVIARLGDNSWWKISVSGTIGWVSGNPQFTTLYGNCGNIPVENVVINTPFPTATPRPANTPSPTATPRPTNTPLPTPVPGKPNLIIPNVFINDDNDNNVITIPAGATETRFDIGITVTNQGETAAGAFGVTLRFGDEVADFVISGLDAGQSTSISRVLTADTPGEFNLRIEVDPNDAVEESREFDNIYLDVITVQQQQ